MKRYIVETLEMTQNFYVIEAESEQNARDISQYASDNWHNTLQTTHVSCNELDVDYLKYLQKKRYWNDITTSYNEVRTNYYEDYFNQTHTKYQQFMNFLTQMIFSLDKFVLSL